VRKQARKSGKMTPGSTDHGTEERRAHNATRLELIDPRTRTTRLRITDGCELDRLLFDDVITADQHWAGGKLAEAVVQAGGTKGCLANVERTSGGGLRDRNLGAVWRVARAMQSVERREGKPASRLLLDLAFDLIKIREAQAPLIRSCLDALANHYGLGRWESFSLMARSPTIR
jgi:hypothetical protein